MRITITASILAALLFGAAPAHAAIRYGRGIAGVSLGDSYGATVKLLGQPSSVSSLGVARWDARHLTVEFSENRAFAITTTSTRQRTPEGVGVGVSRSELRKALARRDIRCPGHTCQVISVRRWVFTEWDFGAHGTRARSVRVYYGVRR